MEERQEEVAEKEKEEREGRRGIRMRNLVEKKYNKREADVGRG